MLVMPEFKQQATLKILHVISSPDSVGGAESVMMQIANSSAESNAEVRILNLFSSGNHALGAAAGAIPYEEISCPPIIGIIRMIVLLRKRVREFCPDIVHVHLFHAGILIGLIPISRTSKKIWTFHHGNHTQTTKSFVFRVLEVFAARRYDIVVAMSSPIKTMLKRDFDLDDTAVRIVPNGWSGIPVARNTFPDNSIVCIAKLRKEKDHETLLRAFAKLKETDSTLRLVLVGDGPQYQFLVDLASDLDLLDAIDFVGFTSDIWTYLSTSAVFVLPSRVEPFGIVILEAMAAGIPVVACMADGPCELIENEVNGMLVPIGDQEAMAKAISSLLGNKSRRTKLAETALQTAELFRSDRMTSEYQMLYQSL
jgi:glycosyltransferase involved in cell wall biosynthesis